MAPGVLLPWTFRAFAVLLSPVRSFSVVPAASTPCLEAWATELLDAVGRIGASVVKTSLGADTNPQVTCLLWTWTRRGSVEREVSLG